MIILEDNIFSLTNLNQLNLFLGSVNYLIY